MAEPYTPTGDELMEAWIIAHSEPGWGGPVDVGGNPRERIAEGKRALARVRRDAAREALDGLEGMLVGSAESIAAHSQDAATRLRDQAATARRYRDNHYPEETP